MANTRSAAKHARQSQRHQLHNRSIKSRLHTLERNFLSLVGEGKKDEATAALNRLFSALDKAAKTNVIHRNAANRKKSRLSLRLAAKQA